MTWQFAFTEGVDVSQFPALHQDDEGAVSQARGETTPVAAGRRIALIRRRGRHRSLDRLASGRAFLLDVEPGLPLAQRVSSMVDLPSDRLCVRRGLTGYFGVRQFLRPGSQPS
ncbi:hypothetical protein OG735_20150 [Streptomyces sp. NBC_01210]|uniref:hypothetical protein n=1 Tax=Streptomyces sp. NBC_01210 TaxID=2903774 RepID=UPI002E1389C3|nr:hypothetical protein OG735_20150 [Streptomyces sp. NBC_01210]